MSRVDFLSFTPYFSTFRTPQKLHQALESRASSRLPLLLVRERSRADSSFLPFFLARSQGRGVVRLSRVHAVVDLWVSNVGCLRYQASKYSIARSCVFSSKFVGGVGRNGRRSVLVRACSEEGGREVARQRGELLCSLS